MSSIPGVVWLPTRRYRPSLGRSSKRQTADRSARAPVPAALRAPPTWWRSPAGFMRHACPTDLRSCQVGSCLAASYLYSGKTRSSLATIIGAAAAGVPLRAARATPRRAAFAISWLAPGPRRSRVPRRLACESPGVVGRDVRAKAGPAVSRARVSALGCQLGLAGSSVDGAVCAAGRSLPDMSLAFALMAAINGSTGSWATLSHGL